MERGLPINDWQTESGGSIPPSKGSWAVHAIKYLTLHYSIRQLPDLSEWLFPVLKKMHLFSPFGLQ